MGRSYLGPPDKGIRQVLFAAREQGRGAIPFFVYNWPWLVAGSPDADQVSFISQTSSFETAADHHRWSLDLFKYGSGGGHVPKPNPKDRAWRTHHLHQEESTRVWPGGRRCGWECSPTTLVA